jgi:hypothetical protein
VKVSAGFFYCLFVCDVFVSDLYGLLESRKRKERNGKSRLEREEEGGVAVGV